MQTTCTLRPVDLRCNNLIDPIGIGQRPPEFSWRLEDPTSGAMLQSAWQLQVIPSGGDFSGGEFLWDSGEVKCSRAAGHIYRGAALKSFTACQWRVRICDEGGVWSDWSAPAYFETGILKDEDWEATWVGFPGAWSGHALCARKEFNAPENPQRARVYLAGSWTELWINGFRLGNDALIQPAQTDYGKSYHYLTYDITPMLHPGENVLTMHIGNGWYGMPKVRYRVDIDGETVCKSWFHSAAMVYPSPVYRNSVYGGEEFDARRELPPEWRQPDWKECGQLFLRPFFRVSGPHGTPRGYEEEPVRPQEEISVASWKHLEEGVWVADFGRNFAGWCRLKVNAPAGTKVTMRFAECLRDNGSINQDNLLGEEQKDVYITAGRPEGECFEPHFTYHGFRFVEVTGLPYEPTADTLTGIVFRTDCRKAGDFSCSNPLVNDIFTMIRRTEESNLHAVPTDCPQRTERMGWLNDMMARCESALYLFDESNLLTKWLRDISEAQDPVTGDVPMTAPLYWGFDIDPVCSSYIEAAWYAYLFYGKRELLHELFPGMMAWVEYMRTSCDADGILRKGGWVGDWVPPLAYNQGQESPQNFNVPHELVATAIMYYATSLLAKIARVIHNDDAAADLEAKAEKMRQDFCREYRCAPGRLNAESQSAYAFAIYCGLLPQEECPAAAARLNEIFAANNYKHSTGNVGTKYLIESLSRYGFVESAYRLISSEDYPGWGYMLANGATTLWERWEQSEGIGMNSHNHPMLGCPCGWLFRYPGGIQIAQDAVGFDRFILDPSFINGMDHARAVYNAKSGQVISQWQRQEDGIHYQFQVPAGCIARVRMPDGAFKEHRCGNYTLIYPNA